MSKRKAQREDVDMDGGDDGDNDSDSNSVKSLVDVDFDFFDPNPDVDYHAFKRLFGQLFNADAHLLETHDLTELVLSQPLVGTTIKTDGRESDPYALLTVLNMHIHKNRPSIKALMAYALGKTSAALPTQGFHAALQGLLAQDAQHLGFVLSERLINMPVQVVPPMYRMLADEIKWAIDDNEPYTFSHFLFLSRTYALSAEDEVAAASTAPRSKRSKTILTSTSTPSSGGIYPFHPEDACIAKLATHTLDYPLTTNPAEPREKDAFGLDVRGRLALVPADRLPELVRMLGEEFAAPDAGGGK